MKNIQVSSDIIPVGRFKADMARYIKEINAQNNSLIITQNGKPAAVLITPVEFDELRHTKAFLDSIARGMHDMEEGDVLSSAQLRSRLKKQRAKHPQ
ncbi:MAG: type II toxin-antitoxin system Phd/YefM family antitoxin [Acidobacteriota bacterium]